MTLYHGLSPNSVRNDGPALSDLTDVTKFIIDGSCDMYNANIDLQTLVDVSKKMDSNRMSIKRSKRLPKTFMIIKLSPLSKLISKRYRYFTKRHGCIILFQGVVKKKKVNVIVFFPYKSKAEKVLNEIKIGRYLSSIASTNAENISKSFQAHVYCVPIKVQDQISINNSIKNRLVKPIIDCDTRSASCTTPISETDILNEFKSSSNPANYSFTKVRPNVNLLKREKSLFPLTGNEEFYLVKRIHRIYIMSKTKEFTHYPTCSKKNYCKSHSVSNIFEQSCTSHSDLFQKTIMPSGGHHKDMNIVMERLKMRRRCIERDYKHMLRQISKLMHTCNSDEPKLRETSKNSKKPKPVKEIMPDCRTSKQKEKSENTCKPNGMNGIGRKIKSTLDWCSKQAKTKLKNNNIEKIIKNTCGMCSRQAKTKHKSNHLDKIIKKIYGQCTQQSSSELETTLKSTKQDCYMFSVHGLANQKLVCESEICHFKENAVLRFWSIMNLEQSKVLNCAAISKRDSNTVNDTSKFVMKQRNCFKSKLLLVKKTSAVFFYVNNFAEYDICLQGMFKDPSKCSSPKSISFNIPEDHESSHSSMESSLSQHSCCFKNCQDMDESKCILRDNSDSELSNECKNKLCDAKTSHIKVKLPLLKCINCTRDHKQCDMGLNTLPQNIEDEYKPIMSRKKPRIIRRRKSPPYFPPECIIEIDDTGKDLASLELFDRVQQKNIKCKQKTKKKSIDPLGLNYSRRLLRNAKGLKKNPARQRNFINIFLMKV